MSKAWRKRLAAHLLGNPAIGFTEMERKVFAAALREDSYEAVGKAVGVSGSQAAKLGMTCIHVLNTALRTGQKPDKPAMHTPIDWPALRAEDKRLFFYLRDKLPCPRTWEEVAFALDGWRAREKGVPTKAWQAARDKAMSVVDEDLKCVDFPTFVR